MSQIRCLSHHSLTSLADHMFDLWLLLGVDCISEQGFMTCHKLSFELSQITGFEEKHVIMSAIRRLKSLQLSAECRVLLQALVVLTHGQYCLYNHIHVYIYMCDVRWQWLRQIEIIY